MGKAVNYYSISLTRKSLADIKGIYDYISEILHAPASALEQVQRIEAAIESLATQPERYALLPAGELGTLPVRRMPVDNYLVFYRVYQHESIVSVMRVVYARRDWLALLMQPGDNEDE
jgi:toxin ParE1/3/4